MSKSEKYSRAAEECSRMAATARTDAERAAWLKIAESWLRLARTLETQEDPIARQFETAVESQTTGQAPSVRQH
ncbi:MAG: hypothetical protein ACREC6_04830 [Hyphomicrobiaceae bacterium]